MTCILGITDQTEIDRIYRSQRIEMWLRGAIDNETIEVFLSLRMEETQ